MKAALAIIFFACVAGSMAADARLQIVDQLLAQGQGIAQQIFSQLQATILATIQSAVGQISAAIGGRFDLSGLVDQIKPILEQLAGQALSQVLGSLSGIFGMFFFCLESKSIFSFTFRWFPYRPWCHLPRILGRNLHPSHRTRSTLPQPRFSCCSRWTR